MTMKEFSVDLMAKSTSNNRTTWPNPQIPSARKWYENYFLEYTSL